MEEQTYDKLELTRTDPKICLEFPLHSSNTEEIRGQVRALLVCVLEEQMDKFYIV